MDLERTAAALDELDESEPDLMRRIRRTSDPVLVAALFIELERLEKAVMIAYGRRERLAQIRKAVEEWKTLSKCCGDGNDFRLDAAFQRGR